jgi:hypothetical protein
VNALRAVTESVASITTPASSLPGTSVSLTSENSSGAFGNPLTGFSWALTPPAGSSASLESTTEASTSFTPDVPGDYRVDLTVSQADPVGTPPGIAAATIHVNTLPVASIDGPATDNVGIPVTFTGAGSSDPDGQGLTFRWVLVARPAGSSATLLPAGADTATMTADVEGLYEVGLRVDDGLDSSALVTRSFTTSDTTPPTVNTTVPTSGASGVGIGSTITVTFSELMDTSTITGATFVLTGGGGGVTGTISFATSSGMTLATLTPSSPLAYATTYTGTVTTGVEDLAGNPMGQNHVWTFTTEAALDTTPPAVISTTPANGTMDISIGTPITVTFSEEMDASSIVPAAFILTGGGSNLPWSVNYSGAQATFTPISNLSYSTTYTATVTTLVEDLAGNPLASNHTWTFTTEQAPSSGGGGGGGCSIGYGKGEEDTLSTLTTILLLLFPIGMLSVRKRGYCFPRNGWSRAPDSRR